MTFVPAPLPATRLPPSPIEVLACCGQLVLLEHTSHQGKLEIGGLDAYFAIGDLGLCIGIDLAIEDPPQWWVEQTTLWLASTLEAAENAINQFDGRWLIWCRYEKNISIADLDESIERHITLARHLGEICPVANAE